MPTSLKLSRRHSVGGSAASVSTCRRLADRTIATAIREVEFVVTLVLEASVEWNWCKKELSLAIIGGLGREGVKVLPLRVGDVEMPPALADTFWLALVPSSVSDAAGRIKKDAGACLADERRAPPTLGVTPSRERPPDRPPAARP
jgi:hypothetical protein